MVDSILLHRLVGSTINYLKPNGRSKLLGALTRTVLLDGT